MGRQSPCCRLPVPCTPHGRIGCLCGDPCCLPAPASGAHATYSHTCELGWRGLLHTPHFTFYLCPARGSAPHPSLLGAVGSAGRRHRAQLLPCPGVGRVAATIAWHLLTCSLIHVITALRAHVLECVLCAGRWAEHVPCTVIHSAAVNKRRNHWCGNAHTPPPENTVTSVRSSRTCNSYHRC